MDCRIFCIGAHKTGTTSLERAMVKLGYLGFPSRQGYGCITHRRKKKIAVSPIQNIEARVTSLIRKLVIFEKFQKYKAFHDCPFNMFHFYRQFSYCFPDSKFILTVRDSDDWFESVLRWNSLTGSAPVYRLMYGCPINRENKEAIIQTYEQRNEDIRHFFQGTGRLLEMNICEGEGWEKLCPFLGHEVIESSFFHSNQISKPEPKA